MIDTAVIRIHDLKKHDALVKYINQNFKGTSKNTAYLTDEENEGIKNSPTINGKNYIDYYWNSKTGTHLIRYRSQEKLNNSGHYYFNVFENVDRNFLEFNFSIPKYIFGTNVFMFCEHVWNKNFNYSNNSSLDYNLKCSYDRLISFIHNFFRIEFVFEEMIDFSDVEINRIDLSFNQVFFDKCHALEYLEYQKKLRKKNLNIKSNNFREYETSLMYSTKRYSVKIYHKGTEYTKHDRKEHMRINKEKGREYFNIEGLQSFSDRMLRYEVTIRDTMLSYLFNHNLFRKNCPVHKTRYEIYKKVEATKLKNDRIAKRTGTYKIDLFKNKYIENHPFIRIDKNDSIIHKKMSRLFNHNRRFLLKSNPSIDAFNSKTISATFDPRAFFSKALFIECAKFFKSFILEFQIKEKPSECVVRDKIAKYNSEHYDQLPVKEMLKIYALLQNFTFEAIMKKELYSRATFYRYKSRFKKIGITQNSLVLTDRIVAPVDLAQYHHHIIYGKNLINK
jgi:hypothetical protein